MDPVTPIVNGLENEEVVYAKDQPEYLPLHALRSNNSDGRILTRWKLTESDREKIAAGADLYLEILTFHQRLQPVRPFIETDDENLLKYVVEGYR